ncbi:MAG: hypothetical protein KDH96_12790, partial [Candidatus Riesia sp.]|nr:hypothetical protein [Candidatus Riesia sp.]
RVRQSIKLLNNYSPSQKLSYDDEEVLLDICEKYNNKNKTSGPLKDVFNKYSKQIRDMCSCINSDSILPQFLSKDCRNRGLKTMDKTADKLVICNANREISDSNNVIESNNNMIACNFADGGSIDPDAFIYAANESKFFLSPFWLYTFLFIVITVSIFLLARPVIRQEISKIFEYF